MLDIFSATGSDARLCPPCEQSVHIWFIKPPERGRTSLPQAVLCREEQRRAQTFARAEDRHLFQHYHIGTRIILGRYLDQAAQTLVFTRNSSGKPRLIDAGIEFNLSHCAEGAVVAVSRGPVGVDVEPFHEIGDLPQIAAQVCSDRERQLLQAVTGTAMAHVFLHLWCRKEAVLKADGIGLMRDPRSLEVGMTRLSVCLNGNRWQMRRLTCTPAYLCAYVASPLNIREVVEFQFTDLCPTQF